LPVEQRAALVLTYYLDLPLAESAQILGVPLGTLKSRIHRSLDSLRAAVEADDREPAPAQESLA
jgi:RNA polymerase sigma-70 factor (ECF subfamily)